MKNDVKTPPGMHEREVFLGALEKPAAERAAFLERVCGKDEVMRRRIEELLREEEDVGHFLETPAISGTLPRATGAASGPHGTELVASVTEKPGDRIGRYKLLQKVGEGGCGVVYMAEQEEPVRRRVAFKIIKLGMDTKSVIARFEAERQALAMMDHPNIARVFDAGATENGRPYFVMELVRGIRITEYCDQNNLSTGDRLKLFVQVCQAIQHAHHKGIIHRDIKPSNILVTLHDGVPVPKVIDFGIAKATEQRLTEKTLFTEFTAFIGTPAYMSPEQAEMSGLDIDTRSDIYSLGVLLYELLTGKTPFDAETLLRVGLDECRRTIREKEPSRPSTRLATMVEAELTTTARQRRTEAVRLVHLLRGDLDWVVMKALEKDRTRRYATANDLAEEVQRYLDDEPVLARPPSNIYRLQKLMRRHQGAFIGAAAVAATLLVGAAVSAWLAIRATRAEHDAWSAQQQEVHLRRQAEQEQKRAEQEKASARLNEYIADINLAQQSLIDGNYGRAVQLLNKHRPVAGETDLRGFEWRYLWQLAQGDEHIAFPKQDAPVQSIAFSPDANLMAVGSHERFSVFSVRSRSLVTTITNGAVSIVFLPDGRTVTASLQTTRVWDKDWTLLTTMRENSGPLASSRDGTRLATTSRDRVRLWDTATWKEMRVLRGAFGPIALSPAGDMLAADTRGGIALWKLGEESAPVVLANSTNISVRAGPWAPNRAIAFSPDGKLVVAARNTLSEKGVFVLSIWNAQTGEEVAVMPNAPEHVEHTGVISSLAFSEDGNTLATASMDHSIRLWDFAKRQKITTFHGHVSEAWAVAFSPNGKTLASAGKDGSVKLWEPRAQPKEDPFAEARHPLGFSKDGRKLVALNQQGTAVFFNLATGEPDHQIQLDAPRSRFGFRLSVGVSEDLRTIAQNVDDGGVKLWNAETGDFVVLKESDRRVDSVELSPNGRELITGGGWDRSPRWWDVRAGTNFVMRTEAFRFLFSPQGSTLAGLGRGTNVEVWDVGTRSLRTNWVVDPQPGFSMTFSADGALLALGCVDDAIRLYEVSSGKLLGACIGHKQGVMSVAFSPDGKTLASAGDDSTVRFWNVATQQELLMERRLGGTLRDLMFSPDGRMLVGTSSQPWRPGGLRFYRAPLLKQIDLAGR